ncbi:MAG: non-hydrolyzing UDP-N-acetylglucosamine 2-epimerase [Oscillospiraceae bacterium]
MKTILCVFGTRPEAIKMAPLIKEIGKAPGLQCKVCLTGQHKEMLQQVLAAFAIKADVNFNIMQQNQTIVDIHNGVLARVYGYLAENSVDMVLVHGDTSTTFAAAQAAFYHKIPVGHVEAGLRTHDRYSPFPEEMNRVLTSRIASYHFAPTKTNIQNLNNEGIVENIFLTGNTVIDALKQTVTPHYRFEEEKLNRLDYSIKTILLTAHRRENLGEPMQQIFKAVHSLATAREDIQFVIPVHLNPAVLNVAETYLKNTGNVILIKPTSVFDMHNLINKSYMVVTDSGGLQEEAPSLGKPVLVLRDETERPEAVEAGTVKVIGTAGYAIISNINILLNDESAYNKMAKSVNPYGDGHASRRIVEAISSSFAETQKPKQKFGKFTKNL